MATIDRKNGQAVEEHSLSSFNPKRGKVAAYSEQKQKKYRVVSVQRVERAIIHGGKVGITDKAENKAEIPKRSETMRKILYGTNRSNRERKSESKAQNNAGSTETVQDLKRSSYLQDRENPDSSVSEQHKSITPEMAERMKRAAYLDRLNKDKIKTSAARTEISSNIGISDNAENLSHDKMSVPHSEYEKKYLSETADNVISEAKKAITPEMAERMKRAAFIEQKNSEAIRLNRATVVTENEDVPVGHLEDSEEKFPTSAYLGNSDKAVFDTYNGEVRAYRAKKAYGEFAKKQKNSIVPNVGGSAVSAETQKAISDAQNVSQTLQSSDSVGSAVLDVSSVLAAVEAKKMVKKLAETDLKKQKRVDERMKNHVNRFGIGSNHKDEVEKDKNEKIKNSGVNPTEAMKLPPKSREALKSGTVINSRRKSRITPRSRSQRR